MAVRYKKIEAKGKREGQKNKERFQEGRNKEDIITNCMRNKEGKKRNMTEK